VTGAVTVAYIHPNEVSFSWQESLMQLIGYDMGSECRVIAGGWLSTKCYGADGIPGARNVVIRQFLERDAEWLLWIDTDMGFAPDSLEQLMAVADPVERPIVGGLCFAQKHTDPDGMGGWRTALAPTIYDWTSIPETGETGFLSRATYPVNKVVRCAGTGSAFILVHRSVFEAIAEKQGPVWYDRVPNATAGGRLMGEDLSFCLRAGSLGFPVYVHTGVRTTHHKPVWLGEQDFWRQVVAPPATEATAVLVPVMRRPQNARPFMESLRASTGLATVYALAEVDDVETAAAWHAAGAAVLWADGPSWATKINHGYRETTEPWIFCVGDDVRFHPGWLDHAQAAAGDDFHVIGTNDLGPRTLRGQDSPHVLVRRSYVDEHGASWDGPGIVCHEGYRHCGVDLEVALAAKQRGVWAMAPGSVVEHLHPLWGNGQHDEVYALGEASAEVDNALFAARFQEYADA
jgi:glycosyltransferase involved in cell wall biosynthesis